MPLQQALASDDLSAMQLFAVPDVWPPIDCATAAAATAAATGQSAGRGQHGGDWPGRPADGDQAWPRQFAVLLAEALTGVRPVRQILPWLSPRGRVHLHRLLPLFCGGPAARVQRVLTTQPTPHVIEMTLIVAVGPRTRALAVRLTPAEQTEPPQWRAKLPAPAAAPRSAMSARWLCTDIEAA